MTISKQAGGQSLVKRGGEGWVGMQYCRHTGIDFWNHQIKSSSQKGPGTLGIMTMALSVRHPSGHANKDTKTDIISMPRS